MVSQEGSLASDHYFLPPRHNIQSSIVLDERDALLWGKLRLFASIYCTVNVIDGVSGFNINLSILADCGEFGSREKKKKQAEIPFVNKKNSGTLRLAVSKRRSKESSGLHHIDLFIDPAAAPLPFPENYYHFHSLFLN